MKPLGFIKIPDYRNKRGRKSRTLNVACGTVRMSLWIYPEDGKNVVLNESQARRLSTEIDEWLSSKPKQPQEQSKEETAK